MEMEESIRVAYTEVSAILSLMNKKYINKIPKEVLTFINEQKLDNYKTNIIVDKPLKEQKIQRRTLAVLAFIDLNYWCDEDEKQNLLKKYEENKNGIKEEMENKLLSVKYKKDNFIIRILKKIVNIFSKK